MEQAVKILLIEDDDALRQMLVTALRGAGHEVSEASNGCEGVQMFKQVLFDLVITDIFMPEEDGIETIFELKSTAPAVKVIAISGGGRWVQHGRALRADEPLEMARHFGADRVFKKPVKLQKLLEAIGDLVKISPKTDTPQDSQSLLMQGASRKRVLIIEDDAQQRQLFKTALENAGYEVFEAVDGQIGQEVQNQHRCDLVVTDIFMPNQDGIEMLFGLKAQFPNTKVIAVSGGGRWTPYGNQQQADEPLQMARRFGADRTLKKPVKLRQLVTLADELLQVTGRL
jgi:CheY-like chemotaxis protein